MSRNSKDNKPKNKLRTAEDVLHRLRWCPLPEEQGPVLIGYDDRVNGPLETPLDDFVSIQHGGDIPEHRIWYFRCQDTSERENHGQGMNDEETTDEQVTVRRLNDEEVNDLIIWDRYSRVDTLFGSGLGKDSRNISQESTAFVRKAMENTRRIEEERLERRLLRQRQRERRQKALRRQRQNQTVDTSAASLNNVTGVKLFENEKAPELAKNSISRPRTEERYAWYPSKYYRYFSEDKKWLPCSTISVQEEENFLCASDATMTGQEPKITIVSWNVLFDLHDRKNDTFDHQQSSTSQKDDMVRWTKIVTILSQSNADIIALQEVTPVFLDLLCASAWVKENFFLLGAAPGHANAVSPSGNIMLCSKSNKPSGFFLKPHSVWNCVDGVKQRSNLVALEWVTRDCLERRLLLLANIHLLADPFGKSAAQARQRELSSVIGQLQMLENNFCMGRHERTTACFSMRYSSIPVVVGDFNGNEQQDEFQDGRFGGEAIVGNRLCKGFFVDSWPLLPIQSNGFTFDPSVNPRARRTRAMTTSAMNPKRTDRIYIARQWKNSEPSQDIPLVPIRGQMLGSDDPMPPSDHFGLSISFQLRDPNNKVHLRPSLSTAANSEQNAWAASAESTTESLLGIVLDQHMIGNVPFFDSKSSLPVPRITLLYGFVDLVSTHSRNLALQTCFNAIDHFLEQQHQDHLEKGFALTFTPSCLEILTHQASATLVAVPDKEKKKNSWLNHLYECMIRSFRGCHQQESRFGSGWTPHVTLGQYGTVSSARSRLAELEGNQDWMVEDLSIPVYSISLLQRSIADGEMHAITSIPLARKPPSPSQSFKMMNPVLTTVGESWSHYFRGCGEAVVMEIRRACRYTGRILGVETDLITTGSYAMGVSLPEISDIDAVVRIKTMGRDIQQATKLYFQELTRHLKRIFPLSKIRSRLAGIGTSPLPILTIKIWKQSPSIDLIICWLNGSDESVDECSEIAHRSLGDIAALHLSFENKEETFLVLYRNVLRVVKLWAYREHIYGASMGYLGGGGLSVLVARVLLEGFRNGDIAPNCSCKSATKYFFKTTSQWTSFLLALTKELDQTEVARRQIRHAESQEIMCVLSPRSERNHARNSTRSTTLVTVESYAKTGRDLDITDNLFEGQLSVIESLRRFHLYAICVQILLKQSTHAKRPVIAAIKGCGNLYVLKLLNDIERRIPSSETFMRPYSNVVRDANNGSTSIRWMIGLNSLNDDFAKFLEKRSQPFVKEMLSEVTQLSQSVTVELNIFKTEDL